MILICPITGYQFKEPETFQSIALSAMHPILNLLDSELVSLYQTQFQRSKLNSDETKLLFIGCLYATELVIFESPCKFQAIELSHCLKAFPTLIELLEIKALRPDFTRSARAYFPQFRIDASNRNLEGIDSICQAWQASIAEYHSSYCRLRQQKEHQQKLVFLEHLSSFASSGRRLKRLFRHLARYTLDSLPQGSLIETGLSYSEAQYIIEYCGSIGSDIPEQPIKRESVIALQDCILEHLSLDNMHVWRVHKALDKLLNEAMYSSHGLARLTSLEPEYDETELQVHILSILGSRPHESDFMACIRYDAKAIQIKAEFINQLNQTK